MAFGATVVVVLHPMKRRVRLHWADGTIEDREARSSWTLEPFDDLLLDWEKIYHGIA